MSMDQFLDALRVACLRLFPPAGQRVVVAVSGGADSCALLDGLVQLARWPLVVCHLDHGLRDDSAADAELLRERVAYYRTHQQYSGLNIIEEYHRCDVAALAQSASMGWEEAGRRARYSLFAEVAHRHQATVVATAHHRNDQAETVIANILRGSGPVGLGGMPESRPLDGYGQGDITTAGKTRVVRPLLHCSHQQCADFLRAQGLSWIEDASNQDTRYWRNRIRHDVLPGFEQGVPGFTDALLAFAAGQREDLKPQIAAAAQLYIAAYDEDKGLHIRTLRSADAQQRMLLWRHVAQTLHLPLERAVLNRLDDLLHGAPGRRFDAGSYGFINRGEWLSWEQREQDMCVLEQPLRLPGETAVHHGMIVARHLSEVMDVLATPHEAFLCADSLSGDLIWRTPHEGERWHPFGSDGSKTVLRYLADRGIGSYARRHTGVVADSQGVVWIPGCTIADRVQVRARSSAVWHLIHRTVDSAHDRLMAQT